LVQMRSSCSSDGVFLMYAFLIIHLPPVNMPVDITIDITCDITSDFSVYKASEKTQKAKESQMGPQIFSPEFSHEDGRP
jgi:hypothetical protein